MRKTPNSHKLCAILARLDHGIPWHQFWYPKTAPNLDPGVRKWTQKMVPKQDPEIEEKSAYFHKNVNLELRISWRKSQPRTVLTQQQQTPSIPRQPTQTILKCASHVKRLPWRKQPAKRKYDNVSPARCCAAILLAEAIGLADLELGPRTEPANFR